MISAPVLVASALLLEALFGWPAWLYSCIRHPVVWMGVLISWLDNWLNDAGKTWAWRYGAGVVSSVIVIGTSILIALLISRLLPDSPLGYAIEIGIASSLIASRSLYTHVHDVLTPLQTADLSDARHQLARIVGRETAELTVPEIAGAALESLAENASDGVIAPVFWGVLFGLPGLAAYKAVNTLDSMIGHKTQQYHAFGGFSARLDDALNFIPARLTALLIWCAGGKVGTVKAIAAQASSHRSPNAGWPESAMAFALGVRLSGPRVYATGINDEPWLNPDGSSPSDKDLRKGLMLYSMSIVLCFITVAGMAVLVLA